MGMQFMEVLEGSIMIILNHPCIAFSDSTLKDR